MNSFFFKLRGHLNSKWFYRLTQFVLIAISTMLVMITNQKTEVLKENQVELRRIFSLENRIHTLEIQTEDSIYFLAKDNAKKGNFSNWSEIALWIEELQYQAKMNKLEMTYVIDEDPEVVGEIESLKLFPISINLFDEKADIDRYLSFIKGEVYSTSKILNTKEWHFTADSTGVFDAKIKLEGWFRE
jgi:hypothetical protein